MKMGALELGSLTDAQNLDGHDRQHLERMRYWKTKGFWPSFFGPRPGREGCYVPRRTQALFTDAHIPGDPKRGVRTV